MSDAGDFVVVLKLNVNFSKFIDELWQFYYNGEFKQIEKFVSRGTVFLVTSYCKCK